jgi:hypothetical protein
VEEEEASRLNLFHHNNFINSSVYHAYDPFVNIWDNGSEGNYWDDAHEQGIADNDGDGIGDDPYIIPDETPLIDLDNNRDYYPLMNPVPNAGVQQPAEDTTPPEILATTPSNAQVEVPVDTDIIIRFSEAIERTSVQSSITILPALEIEAYTWSENDELLILTFTSNFSSYTVYNVILSSNITDLAGNNLSEDYQFWFRTRDIIPPYANAGLDKEVNEDEIVVLNGSLSSDDNQITNWSWSFVDQEKEILLYGEVVEYTFTQPGFYTITLTVYDISNNSASDIVNITVKDITPPIANAGLDKVVERNIEIELSAELSYDNVCIVNYTWSFVESGEKITLYGRVIKYTFTEYGFYVITLNVTDEAGNWALDFVNITVKDLTPPVIEILSPINGTITNQNVTLIYSLYDNVDTPENITTSPENGTVYSEEGSYELIITATDKAGNSVEKIISFTIDKTPPTTIDDALLGWQTVRPITITLIANDTLSGINKTYYKLWLVGKAEPVSWTEGNEITIDRDGIWKIRYYSEDKAGNEEFPTTIELWLDATPPKVTITEESQEVTKRSFTLHWSTSATDVQYYEVSTDGIKWINVGLATSYEFTLSKGENILYVRAVDFAGNIGEASYIVVTYKKPEPKPWFIPGFEAICLLLIVSIYTILVKKRLQ